MSKKDLIKLIEQMNVLDNQELQALSEASKKLTLTREKKIMTAFARLHVNMDEVREIIPFFKNINLPKHAINYLTWREYKKESIPLYDLVMDNPYFQLQSSDRSAINRQFISSAMKDPELFSIIKDEYKDDIKRVTTLKFHKDSLHDVAPDLFIPLIQGANLRVKFSNFKDYIKDESFSLFSFIVDSNIFNKFLLHESNVEKIITMSLKTEQILAAEYLIEKYDKPKNMNLFLNEEDHVKAFCKFSNPEFFSHVLKTFDFDSEFLMYFTYHLAREQKKETVWQNAIECLVANKGHDKLLMEQLGRRIETSTISKFKEFGSKIFPFALMEHSLEEKEFTTRKIKI